jgi:hypothetical protein
MYSNEAMTGIAFELTEDMDRKSGDGTTDLGFQQ